MSTMGEYAPAVPTSGRRIKELNTKYLLLMLFILIFFTISDSKKFHSEPGSVSLSSAILTKLQYYDDWIIREIDERLLPRPLSRKSMKVTGAFMVNINGLETLN